ncbi:MAG: hypothetical protein ACTHOD_03820 [Motilibacteraceae bacterium]
MTTEQREPEGMDRRSLLKRGALLGGALVWTAPVVQSITSPALATTSQGTPAGDTCSVFLSAGVVGESSGCVKVIGTTRECCDAINAAVAKTDPIERLSAILDALKGPCFGQYSYATDC